MKVALVSPYDYAHPGGVTEHVRNLAARLRERGNEVHVIAPLSSASRLDVESPWVHRVGGVVPVPANGSVARITLPMAGYLRVKRLLAAHAFDVIHLHEPLMPALPLTVLRHSRAVNVGTFHAYNASGLGYFYARPMLRPFARKLHGRIAVSGVARSFVGRWFPGDYQVIPNGIDFERFAAPRCPLPDLADGKLNVLFVGRPEKRKGLAVLLDAWERVRRGFPNARLVVVGGSGRPVDQYRRHVEARGWPEVVFTGYVSARDLPRYYQTADVFCAPSTGQESFGIVLLEAMASGRPVVASRIPGYSEVVHHGREGLLVPPRDPESLAGAIESLLADRDLRIELGRGGQTTARRYDWESVASEVERTYALAASTAAARVPVDAQAAAPRTLSRWRRIGGVARRLAR
ncbi:MAG: glycosyltransferase family 4 protein [Chloroflexota bacterium]